MVIGFLVEISFTSTHMKIFYPMKMKKRLTTRDVCESVSVGDGVGPRSDPRELLRGCSGGQKNIQLYAFS